MADVSDKDISSFFLRDEPAYTPPPDLEAFLARGSIPVYIGFGSIVIEDPAAMTRLIKDACRQAGARAIISRGWSKLGAEESHTDDVFYLGDCPHGMLATSLFACGEKRFETERYTMSRVALQAGLCCCASWRRRHNGLCLARWASKYNRTVLWRVSTNVHAHLEEMEGGL